MYERRAMKYIKVQWLHEYDAEPVELYSELDEASFEVRKVEIFRDGRLGFADRTLSVGGTLLGGVPLPVLTEIEKDPQFVPVEISAREFEGIWDRALREGEIS
jgi:hypothetical protein